MLNTRFLKLLVFFTAVGLILPTIAFSAKARPAKKKQSAKTAKKTTGKSKWSGKSFSFKFNPPDGITFTVVEKSTDSLALDGEERERLTITSKSTMTIRKTSDGYTVMRLPVSVDIKHTGREIDVYTRRSGDASGIIRDKTAIVYHLDKLGTCVAVTGLEKLLERGGIISEKYGLLEINICLTPELIAQYSVQEATRWNEVYAEFIGISAKPGDSLALNVKTSIAEVKDVPVSVALKFADFVNRDGRDYARMIVSQTPDPEYVDIFAGNLLADLLKLSFPYLRSADISNLRLSIRGEYLIEPSTMLLSKTISTETIKMKIDLPGQGKFNGVATSTRECSYQYSK
jgi:hypothetical protein